MRALRTSPAWSSDFFQPRALAVGSRREPTDTPELYTLLEELHPRWVLSHGCGARSKTSYRLGPCSWYVSDCSTKSHRMCPIMMCDS